MKMGEQLVEDMSGDWNPAEFTDSFREQILYLVEEKIKAGDTAAVTQLEEAGTGDTAKIYDLTEMLQRSLKGGKSRATSAPADEGDDAEDAPPAKSAARARSATTARNGSTSRTAARPVAKAGADKRKPTAKSSAKIASKTLRKTAAATDERRSPPKRKSA
jgi:DNA end-binding protein Ku